MAAGAEITNLTIDSVRSAIGERQTTASALAQDFYTRIRQEDPEIGAFLTLSEDRAFGQAERIDKHGRGGCAPAAARRSSRRHQGRDGDARRAHDRRLEDPGQFCAALRLHGGCASGSRRCGDSRQAQLRRVCHGVVERKFGVSSGAQSARQESRAGWIVGWLGGSRGGGHGGGDA